MNSKCGIYALLRKEEERFYGTLFGFIANSCMHFKRDDFLLSQREEGMTPFYKDRSLVNSHLIRIVRLRTGHFQLLHSFQMYNIKLRILRYLLLIGEKSLYHD